MAVTWTAEEQEARVARAMREEYTWRQDPSGNWVCETEAGKCYIVSEHGCSCPDFAYRCAESAARCKHQVAFSHWLMAGGWEGGR